jgi:LPS export ABC transporter protein LptC
MLGLLFWNARNLSGFKFGALRNMLPANVDMRLGNLTLSETADDGRTMSVRADSAHYFKDEDYFLLTEVAADIESRGGAYRISARNGRYEPERKTVVLTGEVRTSDSLGRVLTSDSLELDMTSGTFSADSEFCLEDPETSLTGRSFVYDTRLGRLEIEGRIFMLIGQTPAAGQ